VSVEQLVAVVAKTKGAGRCRSCSARITWYRTHPGDKAMPFDGEPVPRRSEHNEQRELIEFIPASDVHWRTCPDADKFRKAKR
jgi:hypothetical protein